jgi:predicted ATPase
MASTSKISIPRITYLRVKNYRALHDLELKDLTPLTVLLGPNGSGKSTVFDVFAFLSECFGGGGLRKAWEKRNRLTELRTKGQTGPIEIELKYRPAANSPLITYLLAIDEDKSGPVIVREEMKWRRSSGGGPFIFLYFSKGQGYIAKGDDATSRDLTDLEFLAGPDVLAVNALGQLNRYPHVVALRAFITGWYLSYLSVAGTQTSPEPGIQEHLSETGDNLANVVHYLKEQHPTQMAAIEKALSRHVPRFGAVQAEPMADGRLLLTIRDTPFEQPILARFASTGTLKMLAYLTLFYDPDPRPLLAIEEPENQLHPMLLRDFAQECQEATARAQVFVTTHSPFILNELQPEQVWVLYRNEAGHTQAVRAADLAGVQEFIAAHGLLGDLWMEGRFSVGDPHQPNKKPRLRPNAAPSSPQG